MEQELVDHLVITYGTPTTILSNNVPQFLTKLFSSVCVVMGVKKLTTAEYQPQTHGQTECYKNTIVSLLRHYISYKQCDWDEYVQTLIYAINIPVQISTKGSPFSLDLSRKIPGTASVRLPIAQPSDAGKPLTNTSTVYSTY